MINKRVILTVTSGRSGTGYLAEILSMHQDVVCLHEPEPSFEAMLRAVQLDPSIGATFWSQKRLPFIEKIDRGTYIETSHLICKGFLEPLFRLGVVPDVIVLERASREISKSLYQLNTIPGRTEKALNFYLSPSDPTVLLPLPNWNQFNDYQLCFWYTLEILMRQKYYATLVRSMGGRVAYTSIDKLNRIEDVEEFIEELSLTKLSYKSKLKVKRAIRNKVNTKAQQKVEFPFEEAQLYEYENAVFEQTSFFSRY